MRNDLEPDAAPKASPFIRIALVCCLLGAAQWHETIQYPVPHEHIELPEHSPVPFRSRLVGSSIVVTGTAQPERASPGS